MVTSHGHTAMVSSVNPILEISDARHKDSSNGRMTKTNLNVYCHQDAEMNGINLKLYGNGE